MKLSHLNPRVEASSTHYQYIIFLPQALTIAGCSILSFLLYQC
jgi:hypothetical protein